MPFNTQLYPCPNDSIEIFLESEISLLKQKKEKEDHAVREIYSKDSAISLASVSNTLNLALLNDIKGDDTLADLRYAISLETRLERHQHTFIEVFIQANLQNIYGSDFAANEARIKLHNNIQELYPLALICCPRRWGKTFSTAWFVACTLLCTKNAKVVVFSPAQRQSMLFTKAVKLGLDLLVQYGQSAGFKFQYVLDNKEELEIINHKGDHCWMWALPAKEDTTRGLSPTLIICEEAAAMPERFFGTVVVPMVTVEKVAMIAISTIQETENYYSRLMDLKTDDGREAISVNKFFSVCNKCRENGKAKECTHKAGDSPSWITDQRKKLANSIYKQLGLTDLMEQEITGISHSKNAPAFEIEHITWLFTSQPLCIAREFELSPRLVFACIDPNGAGGSDVALVTMALNRGCMVILGIEAMASQKLEQCIPQIIEHFKRIRLLPKFESCVIVIFLESNMKWQALEIGELLFNHVKNIEIPDKQGIDTTQVFLADHGGRMSTGVFTTQEVKMRMYYKFCEYLNGHKIAFIDNFITVGKAKDTTKTKEDAIKLMFQNQLTNWAIQTTVPADPMTQITKISYGGKGRGENDDIAGTAQLLIYWTETYCMNEMLRHNNGGHSLIQSHNQNRKKKRNHL